MKHWRFLTAIAVSVALAAVGCEKAETTKAPAPKPAKEDHAHDDHAGHDHSAEGKIAVATLAPSQAATTQPTMNKVEGTVTFTQADDKVQIMAHITGLPPSSEHGFHIHEKGDLSAPDLSSAGPHFNPEGHKHGGPESESAHAGDLGNIKSDAEGMAHVELTRDNITLGKGANSIIGKSVIVHAKLDDLASDPAGNAGARVAGGVIEMKE